MNKSKKQCKTNAFQKFSEALHSNVCKVNTLSSEYWYFSNIIYSYYSLVRRKMQVVLNRIVDALNYLFFFNKT